MSQKTKQPTGGADAPSQNGTFRNSAGSLRSGYNGPRVIGGEAKTEGNSGSALRDALLDIRTLKGQDALLAPQVLEKELRRHGLEEAEIYRLCLLSRVQGYPQLIQAESGQYDVERFVYHALRETGLRRDVVLDLAGTLASLSGMTIRAGENNGARAETPPEGMVFPIPTSFYQEELDACREPLQKAVEQGTTAAADLLDRLRPLAAAGIPEARYYLGAYLLRRSAEEALPSEDALDLLKAAAADGEPRASAALADFYYKRREPGDWAEAFRRYTGFGALALNDRRRIALVDILNQKNLNRRLFQASAVLLTALALLFLVPAAPLYGAGWPWCLAFFPLGGGLLWEAFRRFRKEPYGEYYALPAAMLAAWAACWILRILL